MSLVGSLEDLGLADILQIVSLSRKSGLLLLRSDAGEGRIVFLDGLVRAAFAKGEPEDLRDLLVGGGFLSAEDFEGAVETARERGIPLPEAIVSQTALPTERLSSLRREQVERTVLQMFGWRCGEFSFEVRDEVDERDAEWLLPTGIHSQYLTMEATRLHDEGERADGVGAASGALEEPVFSGEEAGVERAELDAPSPEASGGVCAEDVGDALAWGPAPIGECEASDGPEEASRPTLQSVVAIDSDLTALEWLKTTLCADFSRVHIFQRVEGGVARIRQYLGRAEVPVVLLSAEASGDPLSGAGDLRSLVQRLRAQAPQMPILLMQEEGRSAPDADADALVVRPPSYRLAERRRWPTLEAAARRFRESVRRRAMPSSNRGAAAPTVASPESDDAAREPLPSPARKRLPEGSRPLCDPTPRGDRLFGGLHRKPRPIP